MKKKKIKMSGLFLVNRKVGTVLNGVYCQGKMKMSFINEDAFFSINGIHYGTAETSFMVSDQEYETGYVLKVGR